MTELETQIRVEVSQLFTEDKIDVFVAFRPADAPMRPQPAFFYPGDSLDELVYNGFCQNNLANYLTRISDSTRLGMLVRGCENRSVNALIVEKQHPRENLVLVGIPCTGIIDWRKVIAQTGENVIAACEDGDMVAVQTPAGAYHLPRQPLLHGSCARCTQPNPQSADILIGTPQNEISPDQQRASVALDEARSLAERYAWFRQEAERCIRCYACREACPMCYCEECFVDHSVPRWTESGITPAGTQGWHLIRAFHQTGRCTSCGACERACPMDIHMTYLTEKLNLDMAEQYQFSAGMDDHTQPPFAAFSMDDKKRFTLL